MIEVLNTKYIQDTQNPGNNVTRDYDSRHTPKSYVDSERKTLI